MINAFDATQIKEGSFDGTTRGLEQWRSFLNVFKIGDLLLSLRRDPDEPGGSAGVGGEETGEEPYKHFLRVLYGGGKATGILKVADV